METTKKRLKKPKKGEMEMLKDENIIEKEGDSVKRGQGNIKKTGKIKNAEDTREKKHGVVGDCEPFKVDKNVVVEKAQKKKKNKKIAETGVLDGCINVVVEKVGRKKRKRDDNATQQLENKSTKGLETDMPCDVNVMKKSRKKQRTRDQGKETNGSGSDQVNANSLENDHERKQPNSLENGSQDPKPGNQKKNVRFSDHVEIFQLPNREAKFVQGKDDDEEKSVRGRRFSPEEDEILKKAVQDYIDAHNLGDEGLNMVLNCRSHPQVRNCWKEIAMAIPYRPQVAIYHRAHNLFSRSDNKEWPPEVLEIIKEHQKKHGNSWKALAVELGKHRVHVKDVWRRIKLSNRKKGHWSQEEYKKFFDLIRVDMIEKLNEERKSKHGMLRDNISFEDISDELSTRTGASCCEKWYNQLTSSMVAEGLWLDSDDYRLIIALYELDASSIEDVDWDCLLEHRSGDLCRKRWNQMALHIGYHGTRSFAEQVDVLSKRYHPDLLKVREALDRKPVVDV